MEIYRKNNYTQTEEAARKLLDAMEDFINNPATGKPCPRLDSGLLKIWNSGQRLDWEWSEESEQKYHEKKQREKREADELALLKSDNEYFKNKKIRPLRDGWLREWIDDTFTRPLLFKLSSGQKAERVKKRKELLDWPSLADFESYKTDEEIDALKPDAPSWITL